MSNSDKLYTTIKRSGFGQRTMKSLCRDLNMKSYTASACLRILIEEGKLTKHRVGMNTVFKIK